MAVEQAGREPAVHVPTTWQDAAAACERAIQELANALQGEVYHRWQLAEADERLALCEARIATSDAIDGKNEAQRRAQVQLGCDQDADYLQARLDAHTHERELTATQAQNEVWRERIKLYRALLAVFAKGTE